MGHDHAQCDNEFRGMEGVGPEFLLSKIELNFHRRAEATEAFPAKRDIVDPLSLFGLFAVSAILLCYALEDRHHLYILAFAGACALGSIYGFLQGAWPFGLVEAIWAGVALRRWMLRSRASA